MTLTAPSQRHPKPATTVKEEPEKERKPALRSPRRGSPKRSRSPLARRVQFDPKDKTIPADGAEENSHLMRMKEARDAVPRRDGESRSQWKSRVFQHKREFEDKNSKGSGKGKKK